MSEKFVRIGDLFLPRNQLLYPLELFAEKRATPSLRRRAFLVGEVRGDAVLRLLVPFLRPYLYFNDTAIARKDGRVQALIAVRFWRGDIILDASRKRLPESMNDTQGAVAVGLREENDAERRDIVNLFYVFSVAEKFSVQTVKVFYAIVGFYNFNASFAQFSLEVAVHFLQALRCVFRALFMERRNPRIFLRKHIRKGEVFQLAFDASHTEAVGDRGVDFKRFKGDAALFVSTHIPEGLHIMQAIGETDDENPHVFGDRKKKLA